MANDKAELERIVPVDEASLARPGYPRMTDYSDSDGYGYGYGKEEEGLHLRDLWRTVRKRKWLIITITFIVTTLVTIEAYRTKSTYMAQAFIEIGKDSPAIRSGPNDTVIQTEDSDLYYPQLAINTNLFRLTSEPLLEDVVVNLRLDQNPAFVDTSKKTIWEAIQTIGNRVSSSTPEEEPQTVVYTPPLGADKSGVRSQEESERLAPYVGMVAAGLRAEQVKETRTLKVTYTHANPVIAAAVANGVAQAFIERSFESKTEKFTRASTWLDTTTRELKARVERAEQDLANYTREYNIFSTDGKEMLTTGKLARLHEQATRAETERILKQSLYQEVKAGHISQLPVAFADPKLTQLQTKLEELQALSEKLGLKYGPDNPSVIDTKQQIGTLKAQIDASRRALEDKLKGEYELAARDEQSLKVSLNAAKGEAVQQNQAAIQYNILRQEVDTTKSMYTDFLQKTNQAKVEVAQQHNNLRFIQPARVPRGPIGPSRFRMIMFALFLSLAAGLGLAYFLEYLDSSIKTVEDVGRYMRLPALGVIPAMTSPSQARLRVGGRGKNLIGGNGAKNGAKNGAQESGDNDRFTMLDARSSAAEAYRVLRTSMLLSAAGRPPKTVLVTSGQPGEGKTTTVINTAISLAQLGSSVLIIDCDLRKPSTHKVLGVENTNGLSTYLSRDIALDGLIHKLQIPNLSLLPCGPIPPNPAELLSSERMRELLRQMAEAYDHILLDSPPLINVTDPVILSALVDGVILVVHGGKSTRTVAHRARQELASVGAKIFGVVLNNVDMRHDGYNDYYYQRYYTDYGHDADQGRRE